MRTKPGSFSRREFGIAAGALWLNFGRAAGARADEPRTLDERFDFLSQNGNSNCTAAFADSIPKMPVTARLQGSCCAPMDRRRYSEQIEGLKRFADIAEIPPDPYDVAAGAAQRALRSYALALSSDEQKAYQYAMDHSEEKGPCCCRCWRWRVYGGLAKLLIRERRFTGEQVVEVWNLSDGCGGED